METDGGQGVATKGGDFERSDFEGFLKDLNKECQQKLELFPDTDDGYSKDPLLVAMAEEKERSLLRQARATARLAAKENTSHDSSTVAMESEWREQVLKRKEAERRRAADEAAAEIAATAAALESVLLEVRREADSTPLAVARRNWAANDRQRGEARAQAVEAQEVGAQAWLDDEWLPHLEGHRRELRAKRAMEEQQVDESRKMLQRERDAMLREDVASAAFVAYAFDQCQQRSAQARVEEDPSVRGAVQTLLATKEAERFRLAQRRQAEEISERQEAQKQEIDYQEWKREVRSTRCRRKRLEDHDTGTEIGREEDEERRQLQMQGRDYFKEKEMINQSALEDTLHRATVNANNMKESGLSPRRALEEARQKAAFAKSQRTQVEPVKVEQEMWESLLAKNRHARRQEKSSRTPRWGVFTT